MRDPLGRLFPGLPRGARVALDWFFTIAGAVLIVFALKAWADAQRLTFPHKDATALDRLRAVPAPIWPGASERALDEIATYLGAN